MVRIDLTRSCNSTLTKTHPLVAVFVGGTSGIGEYTIRALATTHSNQGKGLRLYIVGRNTDAAKRIISDCVDICPAGQFRFVQAKDLALLADVGRVCAEIIQIEEDENANGGTAKVDLLVMSQAGFPLLFQPRNETKEGLDTLMSLLYYSRMYFISKLLPLLLASPLPAHVISIYAAGKEDQIFPEDLSLRDPKHHSQANLRSHVTYMTTFFMETLAERHSERLSLVNMFPGLVMTDAFSNAGLPTWFKLTWRLGAPIIRRFSMPPEECGQRILFLASPRFPPRLTERDEATAIGGDTEVALGTDGDRGSGAYAVNSDGETIPLKVTYKKLREERMAEKVWDHTMRAFGDIEAGKIFAG